MPDSFKAIEAKNEKQVKLLEIADCDQVYCNTRVTTKVNTSQHESTRINTSLTQVRHESIRINTSLTRVNTSPKQILDKIFSQNLRAIKP